VTCKNAQGFLGPAGTTIHETVDAAKVRYCPGDALALLAGIDTVVAMRGAKVDVFDLKKNRPDDETLLAKLIGPSGNLRAPAARVGKTLLIGFHEETWNRYLG
jgi:hypothetical protein